MMGRNSEFMEALPNDTARINEALVDLDAAFSGAASTAYIARSRPLGMSGTG